MFRSGCCLAPALINLDGKSTLYLPCYKKEERDKWIVSTIHTTAQDALKIGIDDIKELGKPFKGYVSSACFSCHEYEVLLEYFIQEQKKQGIIFTLFPSTGFSYCWQRLLIERINSFVPGFIQMCVDISPILEAMRRKKDMREIELIYKAVELTKDNTKMTFSFAFNYGGRVEILDAVRRLIAEGVPPQNIDEKLFSTYLYSAALPDIDLVIRPAGELRLSNFLIWQTAYSEYYFTKVLWPDFSKKDIDKALQAYSRRQRRFGGD